MKHSLITTAVLFAFSHTVFAAPVTVSADVADGYGMYLDLSTQVSAKVNLFPVGTHTVGTATLGIKTPNALGDVIVASAGLRFQRKQTRP